MAPASAVSTFTPVATQRPPGERRKRAREAASAGNAPKVSAARAVTNAATPAAMRVAARTAPASPPSATPGATRAA